MRAVGLSRPQIRHRVKTRPLRAVLRGVYLAGHVATNEYTWPTAGLLAVEDDALVCFHSAAALQGWGRTLEGQADILIPGKPRHSRPGLRLHSRPLHPNERTPLDRLPITSPARTVVDLATIKAPEDLPRLIGSALRETPTTHDQILTAAAHAGRARNLPALRTILAAPIDYKRARS